MKQIRINPRRLAIIVIAIIAIVAIISINKSKNKNKEVPEDTTKVETDASTVQNEKLLEAKQYKGFKISNVKFQIDGSITELTADVLNDSDKATEGQYVNFNVLDANGNKITDIGGYIDPIEAGGTAKISTRFMTSGRESSFSDVEITETATGETLTSTQDNNEQQQ